MRGKLLFKTILIVLLIAWALYALWPTFRLYTLTADQKAEYTSSGRLIPIMNKSVRLGLDLQGGMYVTLEVDLPTLIQQLAKVQDETLNRVIEASKQEMNVSSEDFLIILNRHFVKENIPFNRYWGEYGDSNAKILDYLGKQASEAMNRSLEILRNRVDQFGVSEPSIQHMGTTRILIELPGISDTEQAKNLIGKTALLEFAMLKDATVFGETIDRIDRVVAADRRGPAAKTAAAGPVEPQTDRKAAQDTRDKAISVGELFGESETAADAGEDTSVVVDEGMFEENPFIALLRNTRSGHEVSVPIENVGAVDRLLAREDVRNCIPPDAHLLWSSETHNVGDKVFRELYLVKKEAELTGKYLTNAQVTIGQDVQSAGRPEVNFELNRQGARIFSRVSGANIGKRLAIILDKRVVSAPTIQTKIPDGRGRITGIGDMQEAKMMSIVLRAGALPAPVSIIEERIIGPSLGLDSITKGSWSALIAAVLVVVFMIVYYRGAGLIANVALFLNILLLVAALAQFRFTLTMPGIAGIVLTIGMAVDANVLIFERIREELTAGKTVRAAIEAGYTKAFTAIADANVTTILTGFVLYYFGTSAIRGFAVTLMIGLVVNLFTAIVVTRTIYDHITSRFTLTKLSI
ncbi:protein translocase subunit SecD [bacterium]|nr:protein translocase subunit SecD [bacterium]